VHRAQGCERRELRGGIRPLERQRFWVRSGAVDRDHRDVLAAKPHQRPRAVTHDSGRSLCSMSPKMPLETLLTDHVGQIDVVIASTVRSRWDVWSSTR